MISRAQEPEQLYANGGITNVRQPYFLGKAVKKIGKGLKKVVKSPIGKAALIGGLGSWGLGMGPLKGLGGSGWMRNIPSWFGKTGKFGNLLYSGKGADRKFSLGKAGLLGLLGAGTALPFMADEEEEVIETPWETTPDSIANIRKMTKDRDSSLAFLPSSIYAQPGYYNMAKGGRAGLMNGGGAAEAQAENMLKMEYQKYRNQGGTMSYQQFKMAVLKQAQAQGPMAQKRGRVDGPGGYAGINLADYFSVDDLDILRSHKYDPYEVLRWRDKGKNLLATLRMAQGGRVGYRLGELVEDQESMFMTPQGDEVVTNQMEEIEGQTAGPEWFTQLVEHFMYLGYSYDEASDMAWDVGHGKMELGDVPEKKAEGGRVGLLGGGPVPGSTVPGYTTPVGYNKFDYRTGGVPVRVGAANGGIMPLLDLKGKEKDYRNEGGFVGIGRKEKADDVPARLSKNEFVFTADAVRNAGGGDVDAGADVMQNMMKHLEAGGQISEESQGLGAQGMYDNMRQLETRMG